MKNICRILLIAVFLLFPCSGFAAGGQIISDDGDIALELHARRLHYPVTISNAGDGSNRLFIVEQRGKIKIVENGVVLRTPFLNVSKKLPSGELLATQYETGLLGLVFHPQYSINGYFFIFYTDKHNSIRIERYTVSQTDPNRANPKSALRVLTIAHPPFYNHYGGGMCFGSDGNLYVGVADGGGVGDPSGNGQDLNTLLAKILRINVDPSDKPYTSPDDNPIVGRVGKAQIFAYGFRNPWRIFCDNQNNRLFVGDVGQYLREEVNLLELPADGGKNYGWSILEGEICFDRDTPLKGHDSCDRSDKERPIDAYSRTDFGSFRFSTTAIILGGVYRGIIPNLQERVIYGDFTHGVVQKLTENNGVWNRRRVFNRLDKKGIVISSFGFDEAGEMYLAAYGESGKIYKFVPVAED